MRETPRTVGVAPGRGRGVARREGRTAAAACGAERPDALLGREQYDYEQF